MRNPCSVMTRLLQGLGIGAILVGSLASNGCELRKKSGSLFHVYGSIDTTTAAIGDVLHLQLWAKAAGDRIIHFPDLQVDNPNIAVGQRRDLHGEYKDDYGIEFEISFWDTGSFILPPYPIHVMSGIGDSIDYSLTTDPVTISIQSVVTDAEPQLRDLKPPVPLPFVFPLRSVGSIVLIALLLGVLVWLLRQRVPVRKREVELFIPPEPPHQIALEKLADLRGWDLSTPARIKGFYTELSYVIREFLEYQYFVRTIEMTTEEIGKSGSHLPLGDDLMKQLLDMLKRADLAKFAKYQLGRNQCFEDLRSMERFVDVTRREWTVAEYEKNSLEVA